MRFAFLGLWMIVGAIRALGGCELLVAAASDLSPLEKALKAAMPGCDVRISFGSSGMLAQQIRSGADFDVFLAADRRFAEGLGGELVVYARGRIALWSSKGLKWEDLGRADRVAIANPALAPYGRAARQALERRGLWKGLEARIVFSENIRQAWQFARTGNVDAAIVSWSLAFREGGQPLPAEWHDVLEQTAVIPRGARHLGEAKRFIGWLVSREGQKLFALNGLEAVR
ncbi:MAG: molybdate ABC transporter substrate-binding protein [Bryobacteraceae bacterium]|nr:molybdate ABC transporter substrate-binding protein [Bryobacteraceae bacterium]